jgi:hypothetical protein
MDPQVPSWRLPCDTDWGNRLRDRGKTDLKFYRELRRRPRSEIRALSSTQPWVSFREPPAVGGGEEVDSGIQKSQAWEIEKVASH